MLLKYFKKIFFKIDGNEYMTIMNIMVAFFLSAFETGNNGILR